MTPRKPKYRIQQSDFLGIVNRGWGYGRAASWGRWRTVDRYETEEQARAKFPMYRNGLRRARIVYGTTVVEESL